MKTTAANRPPGRLQAGEVLPPRTLTSIAGTRVPLPDARRLVHVQLRRFAGCPVCNVHLARFMHEHAELEAAGVRVVAVFHSTEEDLREHVEDAPFDFVADADKVLYREWGAEAATRALADPRGWPKIAWSIARASLGLFRGRPMPPLDPGGGRWGLPAEFLLGTDGRVIASKYGVHVDDAWSVEEVLALAQQR